MFLILDGEGELGVGDQRHKIRRFDLIACPTGGAAVAHQIIISGSTTMRYLAQPNTGDLDIREGPDSNKIGTYADEPKGPSVRPAASTRSAHR